jgi:acetyltransferase-like isoleucine patch superfamily enzyme
MVKLRWYFRNLIDYIGELIGYVPIHALRLFYYKKVLGVTIGKNSSIHRGCQIRKGVINIGENVIIGENALLDGRKGLYIQDNVNISSNVSFYTLQHDYNDPYFHSVGAPIVIERDSWISSNVVVLPGVTIRQGAVVGAMCLVNKDVPSFKLVGGVPFKILKDRNPDIQYKLNYHKPFF